MTREEHEAVEREDAERLKGMGLRATPNGIVPIDEAEAGRKAAHLELVEKELCCDLAGKFARESAKRTRGKIGQIRDRYETIVMEFRAARYKLSDGKLYSLATALRGKYETDETVQEFCGAIGEWLEFANAERYREGSWAMYGHAVTVEMMSVLALECDRDREGLLRFLSAVFKRWREIDARDSLFRQRLLAQQLTGTSKQVTDAVVRLGAAKITTEQHYRSLRERIRQYRSRDRKEALKRRTL